LLLSPFNTFVAGKRGSLHVAAMMWAPSRSIAVVLWCGCGGCGGWGALVSVVVEDSRGRQQTRNGATWSAVLWKVGCIVERQRLSGSNRPSDQVLPPF
jgi:hypothetical protein